LDCGDAAKLIDDQWTAAELTTCLPEDFEAFRAARGATPLQFNTRRNYRRFFLRSKAILTRREARLGVYTKDVSRKGIGILSPIQLFPKERIQLQLPSGAKYGLEVVRCRRVAANCYECGTQFTLQPENGVLASADGRNGDGDT